MDKADHWFRDLQKPLDSLSSDLHRKGVVAVKHSAKVINPKHEDIFWQKGLLGYSSPKVLQRTVLLGSTSFLGLCRSNMILCLCSSHGNSKT